MFSSSCGFLRTVQDRLTLRMSRSLGLSGQGLEATVPQTSDPHSILRLPTLDSLCLGGPGYGDAEKASINHTV